MQGEFAPSSTRPNPGMVRTMHASLDATRDVIGLLQ